MPDVSKEGLFSFVDVNMKIFQKSGGMSKDKDFYNETELKEN